MSEPRLEIVPSRPAVRADAPCTLDLLLKITPPDPTPARPDRPPLNLGLVLDRSGSMGEGSKMRFAREAAAFAVGELLPTDRVSVTTFDDRIETVAPNAPAADKSKLAALIRAVEPRGSTALHGGWAEGAAQVRGHLVAGGLNRVLLLSDGLANVGESRPDRIADDVHKLAEAGVSTSAVGVGQDYNEDLLEAMARSGDGNYYYVESPAQLPALFAAELRGLTATVGTEVTLAVEPGPAATVSDVLNDFDRTPDGRHRLPNLVAGMPVLAVVRLTVTATGPAAAVARFVVSWSAPGGGRHEAAATLTLPAVPGPAWESLAEDVEVEEQAALLMAARARKEAAAASERGDYAGSGAILRDAREMLAACRPSAALDAEAAGLDAEAAMIRDGEHARFRKTTKFAAYTRTHSKPRPDEPV